MAGMPISQFAYALEHIAVPFSVYGRLQSASRHPPRYILCKPQQGFTHGRCCQAAPSWFSEAIEAREPQSPAPELINADISPTLEQDRTFSAWDLAALWVGLVISITTWWLAGSLVEMGMSWWQGIATVLVANAITLVPLVLNAHPGTKYGIPFPVLARASFGVRGANLPALMRGLVACGWFGINTWLAGSALHSLLSTVVGVSSAPIAWLGISGSQLACFLAFWMLQVLIMLRGIESIRFLEQAAAPVLIALTAALVVWAHSAAGGFGPMLAARSQFAPGMPQHGSFLSAFVPAVTANVGYWATLSLNISDFTRFAKSQRAQVVGQALGLPLFMALFTAAGLVVTSATITIFGTAVADPIALARRMQGVLPTCLALLGLILATISTNLAANVVAPANALVNINPQKVDFRAAALLTAVGGLVSQPWRLIASTHGFIFTWLIGYSVLLGPVGGIMMADYFMLRRRRLDVDALYSTSPDAAYWYKGGWNAAALVALAAGILPNLPGLLQELRLAQTTPALQRVYEASWFVGTLTALVVYTFLMKRQARHDSVLAGQLAG